MSNSKLAILEIPSNFIRIRFSSEGQSIFVISNTVFSIWDCARFISNWRIATSHKRTADQYYVWLTTLLKLGSIENNIEENVEAISKTYKDRQDKALAELTKDKIIIQYRTFPNLENLGIKLYKIILRTKNFNEAEETRLKNYIKPNKKIMQLLKKLGVLNGNL